MFIMVEVEESENCPMTLTKSFNAVEVPRRISLVETMGQNGEDGMFQVTGWSPIGPIPAYAALVEDSGDGVALLVYGGEEGVRLKPQDSSEGWNLESSDQWGDVLLLLQEDTHVE